MSIFRPHQSVPDHTTRGQIVDYAYTVHGVWLDAREVTRATAGHWAICGIDAAAWFRGQAPRLTDRLAKYQAPGDSYHTPDLSDCDIIDYWSSPLSGQRFAKIRVNTGTTIDLPLGDMVVAL